MEKIILASASPRRKQLLEAAEIPFEIIVSDAEEDYPGNAKPEDIVQYIALNKAKAVLEKLDTKQNCYTILSADTTVVLDGAILGKPANRGEAIRILSAISGRSHEVITGVVILTPGRTISFSENTKVYFHELSHTQIEHYVDNYKPYDKAGAYAIQEWIGMIGIRSIEGDFYNVMGLPISRVTRELKELSIF